MVEMFRHFHGIHREFNIHIPFDFAAAQGIDEFLGWLCDNGIPIVIKPID